MLIENKNKIVLILALCFISLKTTSWQKSLRLVFEFKSLWKIFQDFLLDPNQPQDLLTNPDHAEMIYSLSSKLVFTGEPDNNKVMKK